MHYTNTFSSAEFSETLICGFCNTPLALHPVSNETDCYRVFHEDYDLADERLFECTEVDDTLPFTQSVSSYFFTQEYYGPLTNIDYWIVNNNDHVMFSNALLESENPAGMFNSDPAHYAELEELADYLLGESNAHYRLQFWADNEPDHCTVAIDRWRNDRVHYPYAEPKTAVIVSEKGEQRALTYQPNEPLATDKKRSVLPLDSAVVHNFTDELIIDANITEALQNKVFNYYVGRDNKPRLGLTVLSLTGDAPTATCKHVHCAGKPSFVYSGDYDRASMEDFILRVIRHGNNHGPDWLTSRPDFTYMHAENCDTSEHHIAYEQRTITNYGRRETAMVPIPTPCNTNRPVFVVADLDPKSSNAKEVYDFLIQHQRYCRDSNCRCPHYRRMMWMHMLHEAEDTQYLSRAFA